MLTIASLFASGLSTVPFEVVGLESSSLQNTSLHLLLVTPSVVTLFLLNYSVATAFPDKLLDFVNYCTRRLRPVTIDFGSAGLGLTSWYLYLAPLLVLYLALN